MRRSGMRLVFLSSLLLIGLTVSCRPATIPLPSPTPALVQPLPDSPKPALELLLFMTPGGIEGLDPRTDLLIHPETQHVLAPQDVNAMPSPAGNMIAYITSQNGFSGLFLNVLSLTDGEKRSLSLYPNSYSPGQDIQPGDPGLNAIRAILEVDSFDWSPDGGRIVFTGVTADLRSAPFLLDLTQPEQAPRQLASHADYAVRPHWSPDGGLVLYATASDIGQGDGYQLSGYWTVHPDGSENRMLYHPQDSREENLVGWIDSENFLVYSKVPPCGFSRFRSVDVRTGEQTPWSEMPFNGLAFDPHSRRALITIDQFTAQCGGGSAGLYLQSLETNAGPAEPESLLGAESFLPVYDQAAGIFLARTPDSVLAIGPQAEVWILDAPEPFLPVISSKLSLAWASPISGVWVGELGEPSRQITADPAGLPAWTQDGDALYFLDGSGLWVARAPQFQPVLVLEGFTATSAVWLRTP